MWCQRGKFEKKANDGERHREAKFVEEIIVYFEGKNGPSNVPKSHVEFPLLYFIIIFKNDLLLDYCYAFQYPFYLFHFFVFFMREGD